MAASPRAGPDRDHRSYRARPLARTAYRDLLWRTGDEPSLATYLTLTPPCPGHSERVKSHVQRRDGDTSVFKVNVWRGQAEHLADSLTKGDRVMVTGRLRQRSWETPEGERRSVAEIEADEVGASLKFATAKVERASERSPSDRTQGRERQAERGGDFNDPAPF